MTGPTQDQRFYVWDTYWDANRLYSFGIEPDSGLAAALDRHWQSLVPHLQPGSAILDIGCGNGAAGLALTRAALAGGGTFAITGVDEALIDPPRYIPQHADLLGLIDFRPRTPMESLPLGDGSCDTAVSQFGVEFGNPVRALTEAARVLKPKGFLSILALPAQSKAVYDARKAVNQARYLLAEADLFGTAQKMILAYHAGPPEAAELKMQEDLAAFCKTVELAFRKFDETQVGVLSVIVSCLYKVFADRKTQALEEQAIAVQTARTGLALYAARAQATIKAAIPDGNVAVLRSALAATGFRLADIRQLAVSGHGLLAYQIAAERSEGPPPPA
ncbi:MAG: class I SAM-dependent methyltransferase [Rhodospirillaceae bacterium]